MTVQEFETGFSTNLGITLREFAQLEPQLETPYLTAYLDWRPDGGNPGTRQARRIFENGANRLRRRYEEDRPARISFDADVEKITEFLAADLSPSVHGVVIIANDGAGVFEHVVLAIPVETSVTAGPTPALLEMARIVEDFPRYAVLLADQHDATLSLFSRATRGQAVTIEGNDYPRKQKSGGWSQRRYQARADERVAHFARFVAEETRRALDESGVELLIVAGGEVITSALEPEFHQSVKKRIIATIPMDIRSTEHDVIEATMPIVAKTEHKQEQASIQRLMDAIGQDVGVKTSEEVLLALQEGRAALTLMSSDFSGSGWADYGMHIFGVGAVPSVHPGGGDVNDIVAIDLPEEIVRLTVVTGAEGEIIDRDRAGELGTIGGLGAVLRF